MRLVCQEFDIKKLSCDLLCVFVHAEDFRSDYFTSLDKMLGGQLNALRRGGNFEAGALEQLPMIPYPQKAFKRILLIGLGAKKEISLERLRKAGGLAGLVSTRRDCDKIVLAIPTFAGGKVQAEAAGQAIAEGFNLGGYFNDSLKSTQSDLTRPGRLTILASRQDTSAVKVGAARGLMISNLQNHCRDLSGCPSNILTPGFLANEARRIGRKHGLRVKIYRRPEIEKMKMGAFLSVAKGSKEPPYLIQVDYMPKVRYLKRAVLVGKGITFDTGGISIKPAENMGEMRQDMTGAAVVLTTMAALARLKPRTQITAYIPTCENMISSTAYKPGDVVTTSIGKTIEIVNTDAEGRLLLADVLGFAAKQRPDYLIDVATLTGAVTVALGHGGAGILSTSEELVTKFLAASSRTGEKLWQLPLWEEYAHQFKSSVADMTNSGGRPAGTITAALILKQFTSEIPWLHMDIAGVDFEYRGSEYVPRGPSGFGVRVLAEALCSL